MTIKVLFYRQGIKVKDGKMQYQGGKSRISKPISEVINALSRRQIENSQTNIVCDNGGKRERERVILS